MIQFYALSVLTNFLSGVILSQDSFSEKLGITAMFNPKVIKSKSFLFIWGILTTVTGVFKILSVVPGNGAIIIGDLLPALVGILAGVALLLMFYQEYKKSKTDSTLLDDETTETLNLVIIQNKTIIGIAALLVSILHFFFPTVLFL
ncbi:hypothetical protein WKV44_08460 [Spirochaetia bacterium 38H-sp]|uniref:Uncharacterized protein n=1 Tax=Rarispira pelagica TaxID=3141764 RepID=A0ABU9UD30_9SPIR